MIVGLSVTRDTKLYMRKPKIIPATGSSKQDFGLCLSAIFDNLHSFIFFGNLHSLSFSLLVFIVKQCVSVSELTLSSQGLLGCL